MPKPKLILFTEEFPYGKAEAFLENEIPYLEDKFQLTIIPKNKKNTSRSISNNIEIDLSFANRNFTNYSFAFIKQGFLLKNIKYLKNITNVSFSKYWKSIKHYIVMSLEGEMLKNIVQKNNISNTILYSYWMKSPALALANLGGKNILRITRGHGSDIYNLRHAQLFHTHICNNIDFVFSVSDYGKNYIQDKFNANKNNIRTNYLASKNPFVSTNKIKSNKYHLVSCAFIVELKQIDKIAKALQSIGLNFENTNIKWTHIGGGPGFDKIKEICNHFPHNIEANLMGNISNDEIHSFYANNQVDGFINFSTSEGVPVSIMEAISYGCPILASDVGGTKEVVRNNGRLINPALSVEDLAREIISFTKEEYYSDLIKIAWKENFSEENNYQKFSNFILTELNKKQRTLK